MRLAISNIAWDVSEDETVAQLLMHYGIDAIDIAPGKYFPLHNNTTKEDVARVKTWWAEKGIEITGMQALLFGTTGLNLFGSDEVREKMLAHLSAVCRLGAELGAPRIVFGSPKNRDRTGLGFQESLEVAVSFFRRLGDIAMSHGVFICLEPNPPCYGANFMTTSIEAAQMVRYVDHAAIKMQFDTGALTINGEAAAAVLKDCAPLIGHIHASEPDLLPLGDGRSDHARISAAIRRYLPESIVSIEMVATNNEPHLVSIERSLKVANEHYRNVCVVTR
ncbi:hypothetical protein LMG31506_00495 [Cupriavidus yeoncheonensis]|uniref:Xylose isomerase-like TIM barrel domain-containing protein n=1 Tax=Cupriavidus yeoncheonensis TaxID=1462994 RepID=A0A916MT93_9BURK|nr:sugar phosphate isomerase/epimerase family protein [Cupriavidus yeoncheonensis]CAG2128540.1 hypothetical protein LMG31506_00495 [Cupriavidus yeoncheonensis]